jgi:hypothetical protein
MYSTPILVVPKPHSDDLRLVSHQSFGPLRPTPWRTRPKRRGLGWTPCNSSSLLYSSFVERTPTPSSSFKLISDIFCYVDDTYGCEFKHNLTYYGPYKKIPTKQAHLLFLWDFLGIPHKEKKRIPGGSLPSLGFEIDQCDDRHPSSRVQSRSRKMGARIY